MINRNGDPTAHSQQRYRDFVQEGKEQPSPWQQLKNQIIPGDDDFVNNMQCKLNPEQSLKDIPKKQKQAPVKPLGYFAERYQTRDQSLSQAYWSGHYTLAQVGVYFGVSYATVSRAEKQAENRMANVKCKAWPEWHLLKSI